MPELLYNDSDMSVTDWPREVEIQLSADVHVPPGNGTRAFRWLFGRASRVALSRTGRTRGWVGPILFISYVAKFVSGRSTDIETITE
jgi:hypothetical protein